MSAALAWTLLSGLAAGVAHVVGGIDHVAALLPLSVGRRWRAFALGARWGAGHSAGVLVIGALAVLLRERLDLGAVTHWGERLVGMMLIALGLLGVRRALRLQVHAHAHAHEGVAHAHLHLHAATDHAEPRAHEHRHTAFWAGTVHGVAGSAHVLGVLPAVAFDSRAASAAYLVAFAAGTVAAMGLFAGVIGAVSSSAGRREERRLRGLLGAASAATVLVGALWILLPLMGYELPELL
jgi:sulfite exporter TauE/SafE